MVGKKARDFSMVDPHVAIFRMLYGVVLKIIFLKNLTQRTQRIRRVRRGY